MIKDPRTLGILRTTGFLVCFILRSRNPGIHLSIVFHSIVPPFPPWPPTRRSAPTSALLHLYNKSFIPRCRCNCYFSVAGIQPSSALWTVGGVTKAHRPATVDTDAKPIAVYQGTVVLRFAVFAHDRCLFVWVDVMWFCLGCFRGECGVVLR